MCKDIERIEKQAPCYVYDSAAIRQNCDRLMKKLFSVKFLYSLKTNPFDPVIQVIAEKGFGADASSVKEVLKAEAAGIRPEMILYSTPGKTRKDIEAVYGKCVFIADSFHELDLLDEAAMEHADVLPVGLRINPCAGFKENEASSKFGIDEELLFTGDSAFAKYKHLVVTGIHVHLMSQVLNAEHLAVYYQRCFDLALRINSLSNTEIRFVNFGSGIGMVYDPANQRDVDLDYLADALKKIDKKNKEMLGAELYIETGRYVVGNAGKYYTVVTDIKESRGTKYLIVKNGLNGFSRPALANLLKAACGHFPEQGMEPLYTCDHEFSVKVLNDEEKRETVTIVGDLCTAQDIICRDVKVNKAHMGDMIEITNAGSYGFSLSMTQFASHEEPKQIVI